MARSVDLILAVSSICELKDKPSAVKGKSMGVTKTQRRKIGKEKRRATIKRGGRKQEVLRWSIRICASILFLVIGYLILFHKPDVTNRGILRLATFDYNFGIVSVNEGISMAKIPLVNIGGSDLTITGLDSSCGCTSASILKKDVEGPRFGMGSHGKIYKDWSTVIGPGEQAFLKLYFNPAVHPKERGPVTRIVTIFSDHPENPKQRVKIRVSLIA